MNKKIARTAGLLYLITVATGIFSLAYVPSQIMLGGSAADTVNSIAASQSLFQLGILSELIQYTAFLLLTLALYKLLQPVNKNPALLMVALAVISIPISFSAVVDKLDVVSLLSDDKFLQSFTTEQLDARVLLSLDAYDNGILICKIFWGLWLLPFGYLVFMSGFLPRVLGVLLTIGCFSYLAEFLADFTDVAIPNFVMLPASIGEIGTCLWLLIMGAKSRAPGKAGMLAPSP